MSELLHEGYIEDQTAQRKLLESGPMITMISNILNFLDASPMTLLEGPPTDQAKRDRFYEVNLQALIACIIAADESIRRLATGVAKRLFARETVLKTLRASKGISSKAFNTSFWQLSSLILISICDRARLPCTADGLRSVQGYLESRLHLLTSIPVCVTPKNVES